MRIALLGDIALIGRYDRTTSNDVDRRVDSIRNLVQECDYVIANLESPLTNKRKTLTCKGIYIRSDVRNVETLKYMGITHVTLANNHMFDYGCKGANDTIQTLKTAGIKYVGLNNNPELLVKENDSAILDGFCCLSANALNYGKKVGQVKMLSYETLENFLEVAERVNAIPIASVHFGVEGVHYPSAEHINLFRILAKEHSYILHGNHPHAIQGIEKIEESLLIYAQGDLCFDKTPVSSFKIWKNSSNKEREVHRSYIVIIEIKDNQIVDYKAIGLSDLNKDMLDQDRSVDIELNEYCLNLRGALDKIQHLRNTELEKQRIDAHKRNISFYKDRINYKYIGAYINGYIHAKKYNKEIGKYKEVKEKI